MNSLFDESISDAQLSGNYLYSLTNIFIAMPHPTHKRSLILYGEQQTIAIIVKFQQRLVVCRSGSKGMCIAAMAILLVVAG